MAFDGIRSLEWYAHNEVRAYPLVPTASGEATDTVFRLPNNVLLSLQLSIPWDRDIDPSRFFLSELFVAGGFVTAMISYQPSGGESELVAMARVSQDASERPEVRALVPNQGWEDVAGHVTFGSRYSLQALPIGAYVFLFANTQLEVDCIRPAARNISGLIVESGADQFETVSGLVSLRAGQNIRLRVDPTDDGYDVWIDAISGENLNVACDCGDVLSNPIRTINMVRPDVNGNMNLIGAKCLEIEANVGVISIDNPCSNPCCGCEEAEALQQAINLFGPQLNTLTNFVPRLSAQMDRIEFFASVTDLSAQCDTEGGGGGSGGGGGGGGLPVSELDMVAIPYMEIGGEVAGFAVDDVTPAAYTGIAWQGTSHSATISTTACTIEQLLAGTCNVGIPAAVAVGSLTMPVVTQPETGQYKLHVDLTPDGADTACGGTETVETTARVIKLFGQVYVPSAVYLQVDLEAEVVGGDALRWSVRHEQLELSPADVDLTAYGLEPGQSRARSGVVDCTVGDWDGGGSPSTSSMLMDRGMLLLPGWHTIQIDIIRNARARNASSADIRLRTFSACVDTSLSIKRYRLRLVNYSVDQPLRSFVLTSDSGPISPTNTNSSELLFAGVIVTVPAATTLITATGVTAVATAVTPSIPALASYATQVAEHPGPNVVIPYTNPPACP